MNSPAPNNYYDDAMRFWWSDRDKVVSKQPFIGNFWIWEGEYDPSMVISTPHSSIEHSHIQNTCSLSTYLPPNFSSMMTSSIPISDYTWPASNYFISPGNQTNTTPFIFNSPHQVVPTSISYTTPETPFVSSSHVTQLPSSTFHTATLTTQQPPNPIFSYQLSDANNEPTMFDERLERITSTRKVLVMDYSHDEDCLYCEDSSTQQQSITPAFINSQFQIPNHHSQLSISPSQFPTSITNQLPQLPELKSSSMVTVDTKTQNIATVDVSGTLVVGKQNLEVEVYGEAKAVRDGGEDIESGLDSVLVVQEGEVKATSKYENVDKEGIGVESVMCDNRKNVGVFGSVKSDGDLEAARKGLTESKSEVPTCNVVEVFSLDIESPIGEAKVKTMKEVNSKVGNLSDSFFSIDSHVKDVIGQYILLSLVQTCIKGCPFKINFDTAEKLPTMEAKYKGGGTCNVSPFTIEDGVSPPNIFNNREGLNLVEEAIGRTGYNERIKIAIDVVATDFGIDYPIVLIADPFDREDWEHVKYFFGLGVCQAVGDDLLISNPKRIKIAIKEAACNSLLLKVSQIGIATEFVEVGELIDQYPVHSKMESNEAVYLNTLIPGYAQNRYDKEVIKLFCCMVEEDFRWNEHTSAGVSVYGLNIILDIANLVVFTSLDVVVCAARLIVKGFLTSFILIPSFVGLYLTLFCTKKSLTSYFDFVIIRRLMVTLFMLHNFGDFNITLACMTLKSFCKLIVDTVILAIVVPVLAHLPSQLHFLVESSLICHVLLFCYIENHFYNQSNVYNYGLEENVIHPSFMGVMTTLMGMALVRRLYGGNPIKQIFVWNLTCLYSSKMAMLIMSSISALWESTVLSLTIFPPMFLYKDKSRTTSKMKHWKIYAHVGVVTLSIWFYPETNFEVPQWCNGIPPHDGLLLGFYNILEGLTCIPIVDKRCSMQLVLTGPLFVFIQLLILFLWIYYSMVIKDARQSAKDISNYRFMASKHKWSLWLLVSVFHFTIAIISSTIPIKYIEYDASMWKMEKKGIETLKVTSFCDTFRRTLIEVIDTLSATKAAVKKRIGLHYDSEELEQLHIVNFDLKMGGQIIENAFKPYVHAIESNARVYRANVLSKLLKQGELNLGYGTTPLVFDPGGVWKICRFLLTLDDNTICCIRTSKLTSKLGNRDRLQEVILEDKDCLKGEAMSCEAIKMEFIFYFLELVMHVSYAGIGHMSRGVISVTNLVRVRE